MLLIDLRSKGINGSKAEAVCEQASIVLNKCLAGNGGVGIWTPCIPGENKSAGDFFVTLPNRIKLVLVLYQVYIYIYTVALMPFRIGIDIYTNPMFQLPY